MPNNFNAFYSSNIVANFNTNNANQVNVMPPGRKKRSVIGSTAVMILAAIKVYTYTINMRLLSLTRNTLHC